MEPDWKAFPPLSSLRAFEAAARMQGFSQAARVLNVTHAAVAQQVRALERHLGQELIYREGRGLKLTSAGARLAAALAEGFGTIGRALADVSQAQAQGPLRLTMTPAFATQWLMPRLGDFWARHPEIPLQLHPDPRLIDLRQEGIDLGIRFGSGHWPGLEARLLTPARYVVVAAPELLAGRSDLTPAQMSALPWVLAQDWPEAPAWLKGNGIVPNPDEVTLMPNEELALAAARQGLGLHVEAVALVERDVEEGRLVVVGHMKDDSTGYYLVTKPGPKRPELDVFVKWLKSAV